jgi:hypoxanthine phosphoribosyltransferase
MTGGTTMTNKVYYSWQDIERQCQSIVNQIARDSWMPDYVVGITRGGNVPATIISHMLNVRCEALKVALRDNSECETNCWMAEDAFGVVYEENYNSRWDIDLRKNILIVDDINDTGDTLKWIQQDWQSTCFPNEEYAWGSIWERTVRFATLVHNTPSDFGDVSYYATEINKIENPQWIVFPWEIVGEYRD